VEDQKLLEAVKGGIKAELDSIIIYQRAYDEAKDQEVKKFFANRIEEEQRHYNYMVKYYQQLDSGKPIAQITAILPDTFEKASPIITPQFIRAIAGSKILFSSLSTAALLEKNSMDFYQKCAEENEDIELKNFFLMMVNWETQHYDDILRIQKEAEQEYWQINRFEPF